jgi:hypothetical protein
MYVRHCKTRMRFAMIDTTTWPQGSPVKHSHNFPFDTWYLHVLRQIIMISRSPIRYYPPKPIHFPPDSAQKLHKLCRINKRIRGLRAGPYCITATASSYNQRQQQWLCTSDSLTVLSWKIQALSWVDSLLRFHGDCCRNLDACIGIFNKDLQYVQWCNERDAIINATQLCIAWYARTFSVGIRLCCVATMEVLQKATKWMNSCLQKKLHVTLTLLQEYNQYRNNLEFVKRVSLLMSLLMDTCTHMTMHDSVRAFYVFRKPSAEGLCWDVPKPSRMEPKCSHLVWAIMTWLKLNNSVVLMSDRAKTSMEAYVFMTCRYMEH